MFSGPAIAFPPPQTVRWSLAAAGSKLAIPVDEVKIWLNKPVEDSYYDREIEALILSAQRAIERHCQMVLCYSTWTGTLPIFADRIRIVRRPFVDIAGIDYVDADTGEIMTVPASTYHAMPVDQQCGAVFLGASAAWPNAAERWNAVRIQATAGFAITDEDRDAGAPELDEIVRHAMLMTIAALDTARGDSSGGGGAGMTVYAMKAAKGAGIIPQEAARLLAPWTYRSVMVA